MMTTVLVTIAAALMTMTHARRDCAMPNDCSDIASAIWTNSVHASIKSWVADRATRPARNG
jgi:hypothetical protein